MKKIIIILLLSCTMIVSSQTYMFNSDLQSITKIDEKGFAIKSNIVMTFNQPSNTVLIRSKKKCNVYNVDTVYDRKDYYEYNLSNSKKKVTLLVYKTITVITVIDNGESLHCLINKNKQIN